MTRIITQLTSLTHFQTARPARKSMCRLRSTSSSGESASKASETSKDSLPWTLMGRTINLGYGTDPVDPRRSLDSRSEVCETAVCLLEVFYSFMLHSIARSDILAILLQELQALLPDLAEQLKLNKQVSLRLAEDIPAVAMKLVKLREIFPDSNVLDMVGRR